MNNYPLTRKSRNPSLYEPKFKCPDCDYYSIEKVTRVHYERLHVLPILRQLVFDNPCYGCLNPDKQIKKMNSYDYIKLCMTHRKSYDDFISTKCLECRD